MLKTFFFILISTVLYTAPPKAVVFDYGGVVAEIDRTPLLKYLSLSLDLPYKKVKKDFASDALYIALLKPETFWESYAGHPLPKNWYTDFDREKLKVVQEIPGVKEIVTQIKSKGIQVALLSNTQSARARFIEEQGGYDLFDPILLSCHLGIGKPHPKIYEKLLQHLSYSPEECLFIDNRVKNVWAGQKKGIDGIHFISASQLKEELSKREITLE